MLQTKFQKQLNQFLLLNFFISVLFASNLSAKVSLVTSLPDIKYIAEQVAGERADVSGMIRGTDDPHFVMTRPDFLVKLSEADVLCVIGLDLEIGWIPYLQQQSRNIKIQKGQPGYCDTSFGVKILGEPTVMMDRSMGDMHIYGNPHYWNDPINAIQMAQNIKNALTRVDPLNGDYYEGNFNTFKKRLIQLTKEEMKKMEPYFGLKVAVFHDQFVYLASRFKFNANLTIEERPGVPPSVRYMDQVISYMTAEKIKIILIGPYHNPKYAEYVSSKVPGSVVVTLPVSVGGTPEANTYEDTLRLMLQKIRDASDKTK
ncbi:metal ABC transporter substrate-binding protein [Leptospira brenneri]|uniref:Zinc ABC transporter substrate-binding protein n=1 Tax=Leptospira brenneri TaxID=2023182 RepID=A0A2M9Y3E3_9LEPT|nr:metal ABC transporter substrate-binding protein [Leptospira brenneri]PJZ46072.1 ABC transporter substrate-binding protein [Leptospira brenneri]TGK91271.1 zinc ABC transporter substrate-binding protein [Leptospira brenneri]